VNASHANSGGSVLRLDDVAAKQRESMRRYATWGRFHHRLRKSGRPLLKNLARYPNSVLVAGCQRSGTTILTRVIACASGFQQFAFTPDDELDAALILAGELDVPSERRYCFQTVYVNEGWREYRTLGPDQKLIWVLRNPFSVVYSMVYNWKRAALRRLYDSCMAEPELSLRPPRSHWPWPFGLSRLEKACLAYNTKTSHIELIRDLVPAGQLLIVEYDEMVSAPQAWLSRIFAFINEPYDPRYAEAMRADSVSKARRLSAHARQLIEQHAVPVYRRCLALTAAGAQASGRTL
jgi:hypothetical protein